jgi:4-hydroxy-3-polyprenylbenzoate decarboxylase
LDEQLITQLSNINHQLSTIPFIIICDDSSFVAKKLNNYLWVAFTRTNPSHDIYGIGTFIENKHWGCKGPLIFDARIKPHHAPPVEKDAAIEKQIDRIFDKGGSLYGMLK